MKRKSCILFVISSLFSSICHCELYTISKQLRGQEFRETYNINRKLAAGDVTLLVGPITGDTSLGDVDGVYTNARFNGPSGITLSSDNSFLLLADNYNNKIKKILISSKTVSTFVGPISGTTTSGSTNGIGTNVRFDQPISIKLSSDDSFAIITEYSHRIRKLVLSTLTVSYVAGGVLGSVDGVGSNSRFNYPSDVCIFTDSTYGLVVDTGNHRIRKVIFSTLAVSHFVGSTMGTSGTNDGIGTNSRFNNPYGIAMIPSGSYVLITDTSNKLIRKIVLTSLSVTTLAGSSSSSGVSDGTGTNAKLYNSYGITFSSDSSYVMFVEGSSRLRKMMISSNVVTTFAGQIVGDLDGTGTNARFSYPVGVCIYSDLGWFIVSDQVNNKVKIVAALASSTFTPTFSPSNSPTFQPTFLPSTTPSSLPTFLPSFAPSSFPTFLPTETPTLLPTINPTISLSPTYYPTNNPTSVILSPTVSPSIDTSTPSISPSLQSQRNINSKSKSSNSSSSSILVVAIIIPIIFLIFLGGFLYWHYFIHRSFTNSVKVHVAPASAPINTQIAPLNIQPSNQQ